MIAIQPGQRPRQNAQRQRQERAAQYRERKPGIVMRFVKNGQSDERLEHRQFRHPLDDHDNRHCDRDEPEVRRR